MPLRYKTEILIDLTSMKEILWYFDNDPEITGVIDVKEQDLAYVGDICEGNFGEIRSVELMEELYTAGEIDVWHKRDAISIPKENAVYCIRMEPFYIVKNLNTQYK